MSRPSFITDEQIAAWDHNIENDDKIPSEFKNIVILKEVMRSSLWLAEELDKIKCERTLIVQFQFTHGRLSFGRDPWEQSELLLSEYVKNSYDISNN